MATRTKARFDWSDPFLLDQQLTNEERMVRDSAHAYCKDKLAPRVLEMFRKEQADPSIFRELGALDMLGIVIPEEYGGAGLGYVAYGLVARELERIDSGFRSMMSVQGSLVMVPINEFGTEAQKKKFLPKLATGEWIGQHDAAGANANGLRAGTDMANQHRGRGARNAGHVVMLGQPEAVIAPRFRMLREIEHVAERLRCRAALDDGRKIEHREGNAQFANAAMPVWARPRISAWMSWVPS